MSTYNEFGPDRLRFAELIPERLIFRPKKSIFQPTITGPLSYCKMAESVTVVLGHIRQLIYEHCPGCL